MVRRAFNEKDEECGKGDDDKMMGLMRLIRVKRTTWAEHNSPGQKTAALYSAGQVVWFFSRGFKEPL